MIKNRKNLIVKKRKNIQNLLKLNYNVLYFLYRNIKRILN